MYFKDESEFEQEIINQLQKHGWKGLIDHSNPEKGFSHVLNNINEQDLIENWKKFCFIIIGISLMILNLPMKKWMKLLGRSKNTKTFMN